MDRKYNTFLYYFANPVNFCKIITGLTVYIYRVLAIGTIYVCMHSTNIDRLFDDGGDSKN